MNLKTRMPKRFSIMTGPGCRINEAKVFMQYLVIAHDYEDDDAFKRRMAARDAHIQMGDQMRARGELLFGVALLDDEEKMVGSLYVVDFPKREALDAWLKVEPYVLSDVWDEIEIQPCRVGPTFTKSLS